MKNSHSKFLWEITFQIHLKNSIESVEKFVWKIWVKLTSKKSLEKFQKFTTGGKLTRKNSLAKFAWIINVTKLTWKSRLGQFVKINVIMKKDRGIRKVLIKFILYFFLIFFQESTNLVFLPFSPKRALFWVKWRYIILYIFRI